MREFAYSEEVPVFCIFTLRAVVTDGHREKLAKLFRLHQMGHVLKRAALRQLARLADHADRFVKDDWNSASFVVNLPENVRG